MMRCVIVVTDRDNEDINDADDQTGLPRRLWSDHVSTQEQARHVGMFRRALRARYVGFTLCRIRELSKTEIFGLHLAEL